jgi:putative protease
MRGKPVGMGEPGPLPELLAPAGSLEALEAAIAAGADAVYLGGPRFSARQYAPNIPRESIPRAIDEAHRHGVRVYITVNTLIAEREREEALEYLLFLYESGADAVLLQDAGLAALAQEILPAFPLHASTQMTIHSTQGVLWAAEHGFTRVVLARELSAAEVEEIAEATESAGIQLEAFIHGALCYAYSGQCLLSSSIGGRSGNRGRCAQPCRKPYQLVNGEGDPYDRISSPITVSPERYVLSPHDLCTYAHLDRVVSLPLAALKIEGRMKSPAYVSTVVRIYRQALDALRSGTWEPRLVSMDELFLAFNRGFTPGYLLGARRPEVLGGDPPDHHGLFIGEVIAWDPSTREVRVRGSGAVLPEAGDGIHFLENDTEVGMRCITPARRDGDTFLLTVTEPVKRGARLYITRRAALQGTQPIHRPRPSIPVDLRVVWEEGRPTLDAVIHPPERPPFPLSFRGSEVWESARGTPLTAEEICHHLGRTGGTPFQIHCQLEYPGGLYLPRGKLNQLRRDFLVRVEQALVSAYRPSPALVREAKGRWKRKQDQRNVPRTRDPSPAPDLNVHVSSLEAVNGALKGGAMRISLEHEDPELLRAALASTRKSGAILVWRWPRITRNELLRELVNTARTLHQEGLEEILVSSGGAASALAGTGLSLSGSADLNLWNHDAVMVYAQHLSSLTLSPELSLEQIGDLTRSLPSSHPRLEVISQGNLEVMVSENCLFARNDCRSNACTPLEGHWALRDARDRLFPLVVDQHCQIHIYNSVETCYIDQIPGLIRAGIDRFGIDARHRTSRYAEEMTVLYREALDRVREGRTDFTDLNKAVKERARGGLTYGPLLRGLQEE